MASNQACSGFLTMSLKTNFKLLNAFADKDETLNYRVLFGITLSANRTERQKLVLRFIMNHLTGWRR